MANLKLVVGLGNPTAKYEETRHNAGFWFLDELARQKGAAFSPDQKLSGLVASFLDKGDRVYLLKPMQYMNRSGESVASFVRFYKIGPESILVAHDELDFAPGQVRFKVGGGHGGHNGLRDIVAKLGASDFSRLRFGIGRPVGRIDVSSYVLSRPDSLESDKIRESIKLALDSFSLMLDGDAEKLMNKLHTSQRG